MSHAYYWIIRWTSKSTKEFGYIYRSDTWIAGYRTFLTRKEAREHIKKYGKEYNKECPGITFSYHFFGEYTSPGKGLLR